MDYKYISQLLDRYWQGETTLEEEQILKSFFSQICVPEELQKYRNLFLYEQSEQKATTPLGDDFDERLLAMVNEPQAVKARTVTLSQRLAPLFKAAAMVAIVLALSQAAQFSFEQTTDGSQSAVPSAYTPRPNHGTSVALNDSAHTDTTKHVSTVNALQPTMGSQGIVLK